MDNNNNVVDNFDKLLGQYHGLPDVVQTRPATVRSTDIVSSETFIIQTVRHATEGDILFIEHVTANKPVTRLVLPPNVSAVIARQRDQLALQSRRKQGRRLAEALNGQPDRVNPLLDPKVRAKALKARKAKAAARRARREARRAK